MNIYIVNEYRTEIVLTADELAEMDITYDELDYGNAETRRVLWTLLGEVRKRYGTDMDLSGKLLIEVCREPQDRYRICFTSLPARNKGDVSVKQLVKTCASPVAIECPDIDTAVKTAEKLSFEGKSVLYTDKRSYRLFLYADAVKKPHLYAVGGEYGTVLDDTAGLVTAECEEHWQLIEAENAVGKLRMLI